MKIHNRFLMFSPTALASAAFIVCTLSPALSAATVDDLTFTLINGDTEYEVTDCADSATGSLTIPATYLSLPVTSIGENAFLLSQITDITLPEGIVIIKSYSFYFSALRQINLPDSLRVIDFGAFSSSALRSISLPSGLTHLGQSAFNSCANLAGSVRIPDGITEIPANLFADSGITSITLHAAVTSIAEQAFHETGSLSTVVLEGAAPSLGNNVFANGDNHIPTFYIYSRHRSSFEDHPDWDSYAFVLLDEAGRPIIEAFTTTHSFDSSTNALTIHSRGERAPSGARASVALQERASLIAGDWLVVAEAEITETVDSATGVVTRSFTLDPSTNAQGFYRLHYAGSGSEGAE